MMNITDTIPDQIMPDDRKISNCYSVVMRLWAKESSYGWELNLSEYYEWADENSIELEHWLFFHGEGVKRSKVLFALEDDIYAMAFKLRWL